MALVDAEALEPRELARIFIAWTLRDAQRAEALLTAAGVDYVVRVEPIGRTLFRLKRNGAVFYVVAEQADFCAEQLQAAGLSAGVVPADSGDDDRSA